MEERNVYFKKENIASGFTVSEARSVVSFTRTANIFTVSKRQCKYASNGVRILKIGGNWGGTVSTNTLSTSHCQQTHFQQTHCQKTHCQ